MSILIDIVSCDSEVLNVSKKELASEEYEIRMFKNPEKALESIIKSESQVIIADQDLNTISGLGFLKQVEAANPDSIRILLMNTPDLKTATQVVNDGIAKKIIPSPWSENELKRAVKDSLELMEDFFSKKSLHNQVHEEKEELEKWDELLKNSIKARTKIILQKKSYLENVNRELQKNIFESIKALFSYLEKKNRWIGTHSKKVAAFSNELAKHLNLTPKKMQMIEMGALLHDIGKIGISDKIISKQTHLLSKEQQNLLKEHPLIGQNILSPIFSVNEVGTMMRHHHEHWEGSGYPNGLAGEDIPLGSRVIAVANVFTNLMEKVYQRSKDPTVRALKDLMSQKGLILEPRLVDIFLEIIEEKRRNPPKAKREKQVSLSEINDGMLISRDILTTRGTIVLTRGTLLTKHHIQYVKEFDRLEKIFEEIFIYVDKEVAVAEEAWAEQEYDVWNTDELGEDEIESE